ncbi:membrane-fusion protein [Catenovulum agarivorans DS-2]|uniref:Membrane-fusion protein n=1 Tax=Catenovulum agarivorans DS-2 TaxID=1328313 RepID=W7R3Q1_9ALTE|nr:efflux RND transporter periplasmic adaptor subunit [Catenovulum agarivorans]EWH12255.1 membrane-fusion protein [Catenovulum agarivorans DS-2]
MVNNSKKYALPLILAIVIALIIVGLNVFKPVAKRGRPPANVNISVDVLEVKPTNYRIEIESYGLVKPRIQTQLSSQVSGKVVFVADAIRSGGFFNKGDLLIEIEDVDYQASLQAAYASFIEAEQSYQQQLALAEQAKLDWQRLGKAGEPSDLVLRKPQLAAAKAKLNSAAAMHKKAQLDLARTKITAPFDGRALSLNVDIAKVVGANSALAEIYATDVYEVRLPIKNNEIALLDLPEPNSVKSEPIQADILNTLVSEKNPQRWSAQIVRTAAAIDSESRQLNVVAQIAQPFSEQHQGKMPLKIAQYVKAKIYGNTIEQAIVVDNQVIYQGQYVYVYQDGTIERKPIEILWQNADVSVISSGLNRGDLLVTTSLGQLPSGTQVKLSSDKQGKAGKRKAGKQVGENQ